MKSILTILTTAIITAAATFFLTRNFCMPASLESKRFERTFVQSTTSRQYPADSGRMDIDTLQAIATRAYNLLGQNGIDSAIFANHIGLGVVAFTISAADLMNAMNVTVPSCATCNPTPQMQFVRVYLGFNDSTGYRMFVVPVGPADANSKCICGGKDLFFDTVGGKLAINPNGGGRFVLDLITPCPSVCDMSSRLLNDSIAQAKVFCSCPTTNPTPATR